MTTSTRSKAADPAPSTAHPTIIHALSACMDDIGAVRKNQTNTNQHYQFRGIDAVVNASSPVFRQHGVVVSPRLISADYEAVAARNGGAMTHARVIVEYTFRHTGGDDSLCVTVPGEAFDSGDKSVAKAMSVAFRIALLQSLSLPTDDTDPDAQSYERGTGRVDQGTPAARPNVSASQRADRAKQAIDNARTVEEVQRLREVVEGYDKDGTFTPEQAGALYERADARTAHLESESSSA